MCCQFFCFVVCFVAAVFVAVVAVVVVVVAAVFAAVNGHGHSTAIITSFVCLFFSYEVVVMSSWIIVKQQ